MRSGNGPVQLPETTTTVHTDGATVSVHSTGADTATKA